MLEREREGEGEGEFSLAILVISSFTADFSYIGVPWRRLELIKSRKIVVSSSCMFFLACCVLSVISWCVEIEIREASVLNKWC